MARVKQPKPVTIDFETFGIKGRPDYPPKPVGVSIKKPGQRKAKYYGWGHPTKNNCTKAEAVRALKAVWRHKDGLCFQNGKFDVDVAEVHLKLPQPSWDRIHDTMFLLFLDDPHQKELSLKPSSERLLGMPPEEQDAVCDWLLEHQPIEGVKISASRSSPHYFGAYIAYAPGDLVGTYANGDVERTEKLFNLLWKKTVDRGMLESYQREQRLMPILLKMERKGVPVDHKRLASDVKMYCGWRDKIDAWIIRRIKAPEDINLNSGVQLMNAMLGSGKVDEDKALLTPTGKFQTNKNALLVAVNDKVLLAMLRYRAQLNTCLDTFMIPWLKIADKSGGLIYTTWNQVKSPKGKDSVGTRTGRLSSTPNFQNMPNVFQAIWSHDKARAGLPRCPFPKLPGMPKVRSYIVPFENQIFIDRDYSQQEPRILAHFDGGELLEKYEENPWIDFHDYAKDELAIMGKYYERKPVKNTNLGLIYGMGVGALAERNEMSVEESGALKKAILSLYPGLKEMYKDMKARARTEQPIRTWGGREYYCEEPKLVKGRIRTFDYKMVNVLIQGSAADCTKEAIIQFDEVCEDDWHILLNVHDQITASVPKQKKTMEHAMELLRWAMESVKFDVPMLTEGTISLTNWDELKDYDKKGKRV